MSTLPFGQEILPFLLLSYFLDEMSCFFVITRAAAQCLLDCSLETVFTRLVSGDSVYWTGHWRQCSLHWSLETVFTGLFTAAATGDWTGHWKQCILDLSLETVFTGLVTGHSIYWTGDKKH